MTDRRKGDLTKRALEMATAPDGVTSAELQKALSVTADFACSMMARQVRAGKLFRAQRAGFKLRWFDTAARAAAWELQPAVGTNHLTTEAPKLVAIGKPMKSRANKPGAGIAPPQQPREKRVVEAVEVDYSRAKVTRCPSVDHDPRYQLPPGAHPYGAGFAAVGVGRDVGTGRAWAGAS